MLEYSSIAELCQAAEQAGTTISQTALADQSDRWSKYRRFVPAHGGQPGRDAGRGPGGGWIGLRSTSGLTGGDAAKIGPYAEQGGITGAFLNRAMARAIAVSEYNAAMGKVVAAPTAGPAESCRGTVVSMLEEGLCDERAAVMALYTAGAIGMVIAQQASIAGAQGGCQAECGSASAMAAAALVELCGGTPTQSVHACAMAIKNQLGLVCDPVVNLVEIPLHQAQRLRHRHRLHRGGDGPCGIESKIPADECIQAMRAVGDSMPCALKETAQGLPRRPPG